jgi:hypothetical protein
MMAHSPKLSGKTALRRCPPPAATAQYDDRPRRKHALQHLPSIAAQPDIHSRLHLTIPNDRSEPALQESDSDKTFIQRNWVSHHVRKKEPNAGS